VHVVQEIGEEVAAERVVAEILNDGAAVRVRARLVEIGGRRMRIFRVQQRTDVRRPQGVDVRFVREDGIRARGPRRQQRRGGN